MHGREIRRAMTTREFEVDRQTLVRLALAMRRIGLTAISGLLQKDRNEIFRQPTFETNRDYPAKVGHFYLLPDFLKVEPLGVDEIDNIHIGHAYAASGVEGGPFIQLMLWEKADHFKVHLSLQSKFVMRDLSIVKPSKPLREAFKDLCRVLDGDFDGLYH